MVQPINKKNLEQSDVINEHTGEQWLYSDTVKDHFFHPRNLLLTPPADNEFNARGTVGSVSCGDVMDIWLKIDPATERIKDLKWKTFGCGSAIAATSMFSVMVTENGGLTIDEALKIKPLDIIARLDGLPNRKIHCSVLVDQAFKQAVKNYFLSTGQVDRKIVV